MEELPGRGRGRFVLVFAHITGCESRIDEEDGAQGRCCGSELWIGRWWKRTSGGMAAAGALGPRRIRRPLD